MLKDMILPAATLALAPAVATADTTIAQMAPQDTFVVISLDNADEAWRQFKETGLWDFFQSDAFERMIEDMAGDLPEDPEQLLDELRAELDMDPDEEFPVPTGTLGFAVFSSVDPNTGMPQVGMLATIGYGEEAGRAGDILLEALDLGAEDDELEYEEIELAGRSGYTVRPIMPEADVQPDDPMGGGFDDPFGGPGAADDQPPFEEVHILRADDQFIISTTMDALKSAVDAVDGMADQRLDGQENFQTAHDRLGEVEGFTILHVDKALQAAAAANPMMGMMTMMLEPIIGRIDAISLGLRVQTDDAMIEMPYFMHMPAGPGGLFSLIDEPLASRDVPGFVPPSAVSYSASRFQFDELADWFMNVARANPMLAGNPQMAETLPQIESFMRRLGETLGDNVYSYMTLTRPVNADSVETAFAIEVTDPQGFENLIAEWTVQVGVEPRDFLGSRIYTFEGPMMPMGPGPGGAGMSMSLGIGGQYVFAGETEAVESALRAATRQDDPQSIVSEPVYRQAVGRVGGSPSVAWGFSKTADAIEAQVAMLIASLEEQIRMLEDMEAEFGEDFIGESKRDLQDQIEALRKLDFDALRRNVGPSVWNLRAADDGMEGTMYLLPGDADE